MSPLFKFGIFVALAGVLSALFAVFPDHPNCSSAPYFPSLPGMIQEVKPAPAGAKPTPEETSVEERRERPTEAPVSRRSGRALVA